MPPNSLRDDLLQQLERKTGSTATIDEVLAVRDILSEYGVLNRPAAEVAAPPDPLAAPPAPLPAAGPIPAVAPGPAPGMVPTAGALPMTIPPPAAARATPPGMPQPPPILSQREWVAVNFPEAASKPFIYRAAREQLERRYDQYLQRMAMTYGMQGDYAKGSAGITRDQAMAGSYDAMAESRARPREPRTIAELLTRHLQGEIDLPEETVKKLIDLYRGNETDDDLGNLMHQQALQHIMRDPDLTPVQRQRLANDLKKGLRTEQKGGIMGQRDFSEAFLDDTTGAVSHLEERPVRGWVYLSKMLERKRDLMSHKEVRGIEALLDRYRPTLAQIIEAIHQGKFEYDDGGWLGRAPGNQPSPEEFADELEYVVIHALSEADQKKLLARQTPRNETLKRPNSKTSKGGTFEALGFHNVGRGLTGDR